MCDVPYGVLLSGGLDSSLVASVMSRLIKSDKKWHGSQTRLSKLAKVTNGHKNGTVVVDSLTPETYPVLHSFSIGLPGSPDLKVVYF